MPSYSRRFMFRARLPRTYRACCSIIAKNLLVPSMLFCSAAVAPEALIHGKRLAREWQREIEQLWVSAGVGRKRKCYCVCNRPRLCENSRRNSRRCDAFDFRIEGRKVLNVRASNSHCISGRFESVSVFAQPRPRADIERMALDRYFNATFLRRANSRPRVVCELLELADHSRSVLRP